MPVWRFLTQPIYGQAPNERVVFALAVASQWIIGTTELLAGIGCLVASAWPRRRLSLTNLSCGLSTGLFGTFLLVMFAMHDKNLPQWNQYPAILAWIGVTWLSVYVIDPAGPFAERTKAS